MAQQTVTFSLTLTVGSALTVTTTTLPAAAVGKAYSFQMGVMGGTPPYTWTSSGLPGGLTISSGGLISGTPTVGGNFNISFTVTDSGV